MLRGLIGDLPREVDAVTVTPPMPPSVGHCNGCTAAVEVLVVTLRGIIEVRVCRRCARRLRDLLDDRLGARLEAP